MTAPTIRCRARRAFGAVSVLPLFLVPLAAVAAVADPAGASSPPANASATASPPRPVVEQKLRLMESLLRRTTAKAPEQGQSPEGNQVDAALTQLVDEARAALAAGHVEQASGLLDRAIRQASAGSHRQALGQDSHQMHLQELAEQVNSYRGSIMELEQDPQMRPAAHALRERLDTMVAEAAEHDAAGRFGEAHRLMRGAYQLAVAELGRLRSGKTVVVALKFQNPQEEYDYEQRRHRDHEMLLQMALAEREVNAAQRAQVDDFVTESRRLSSEAGQQASGGKYTDAVRTMEKATTVLVQALRSVGVPLF